MATAPSPSNSVSTYSFKNGFSLVAETFLAPANATRFCPRLSSSSFSHGSLWVDSATLCGLETSSSPQPRPALTIGELVKSNVGQQLRLLISSSRERSAPDWICGEVLQLLKFEAAGESRFADFIQIKNSDNGEILCLPLSDVLQVTEQRPYSFCFL